MKPSGSSSLPHCLLCSDVCTEPETPQMEGGMVGAVRCRPLERHLLQFFILRQLLEIPSSWCEQTLQAVEENGAPDSWFRVCSDCIANWVGEAWQTYQRMLDLESKMKTIKENIRESMKKDIKRKPRRKYQMEMGVEGKIKHLLFPDLVKEFSPVKSQPKDTSFGASHFLDDLFLDEASDSQQEFEPYSNEPYKEGEDNDDELYDEDGPILKRKRQRKNNSTKTKTVGIVGKRKQRRPKPKLKSSQVWKFCSKCSTRFSSTEELENHLIAHEESEKTGGIYDCKLCLFPARDSIELELHTDHRHNFKRVVKMNPCPKCEFTSVTWIGLKAHFEAEHPDAEELADFQLRCTVCQKDFEVRSSLVNHQKKMHPEMFGPQQESIPCDQCPQLFPSLIHLQYHIRTTHSRITRFVCDTCGKGFRFIKSLERHKVSHQKGNREFVCHVCGVDYAYQSVLDAHYRKFHPEAVGKEDGSVETKPIGQTARQEEFACKFCDLKTPYRPVMIRHMEVHKAEMGHQCDLCGKYYTNAPSLKRHKRINHSTTNETVNCPYCFKQFPTVDYMKTHMVKYCKLKHLKENPENAPENSVPSARQTWTSDSRNNNANDDVKYSESQFSLPSSASTSTGQTYFTNHKLETHD